jgi:hypothetical protein
MTQAERILAMLKLGPVCGSEFSKVYIARYGARIYDLRQQGHEITTRPCKMHQHESAQLIYELADKDQMALFA